MSARHDGGPAFPVHGFEYEDNRNPDEVQRVVQLPYTGMTLRDYFAAKALSGLLAGCPQASSLREQMSAKLWAIAAYTMADAMLAAREGGAA